MYRQINMGGHPGPNRNPAGRCWPWPLAWLVLALAVPAGIQANESQIQAFQDAGCTQAFFDAFNRGTSDAELQKLSGKTPDCFKAWLTFKSSAESDKGAGASRGVRGSATSGTRADAATGTDPLMPVQQSLLGVHCHDLGDGLKAKNLDVIANDAKNAANADCAILVALEYRQRHQTDQADRIAKDVIRVDADSRKPTYPLILFYKIAYLGGDDRDLAELQRAQGQTGLARIARDLMLEQHRPQIDAYLKDPRGKDCPDLGNALSADNGTLVQALKGVCKAYRDWDAAWRQRTSGGGNSGPPTASELGAKLDAFVNSYPVLALGDKYDVPGWVGREVRPAIECAEAFETPYERYQELRARNGKLAERRSLLKAAVTAAGECQSPLLLPISSAQRELEEISRETQAAPGQDQQRTVLERDIEAMVDSEATRASYRVANWRTIAQQLPGGLSPGYASLLDLLDSYERCSSTIQIGPHESVPQECRQFGPQVQPGYVSGQRAVIYSESVANAIIRKSLNSAKNESPPARTVAMPEPGAGQRQTLAQAFMPFQSDKVLNAKGFAADVTNFKNSIELSLRGSGHSTECISPDTMNQIRPTKAWVWIAFADCRLGERNWEDTAKNLDTAARSVGPTDADPLRGLVVRRLLVLQDQADTAGVSGYGHRELGNRIGLKPQSLWLRNALLEANQLRTTSQAPVQTRDINDRTESAPPLVSSEDRKPCTRTELKTGGVMLQGDCRQESISRPQSSRYTTEWGKLKHLEYYKSLSQGFLSDPKEILVTAEKAGALLFQTFSYWDALALEEAPPTLGASETWLARQLSQAQGSDLTHLARSLWDTEQRKALANQGAWQVREFILRHAVVRRALELGCSQLASTELDIIKPAYFGPTMVPDAFRQFHDRVVSAAEKMSDSGQCPAPSQ